MNQNPIDQTDRQLIANFQKRLDELRERLKISERAKILYCSDLTCSDDEVVMVEADGFGGAVLRVVEGNYPIDYLIRDERVFSTEAEAERAAEALTGVVAD